MIQFDHGICNDLESALSREWLETNGLGGFSSSTIIGLNTRRYHGLLTAATRPPVGRFVLLSKLEETLIIDGRRYELSANQYPGVVHPQGFRLQTGFRLDPFPVFTYEVEELQIEKSVFMVQGENATVIQYQIVSPKTADSPLLNAHLLLEVRPLIAFRDYHSTAHENSALNPQVDVKDRNIVIRPYGDLPELHLAHDTAALDPTGFWYRSFQYRVEQERGLDFAEDLFSPFAITFNLRNSDRARIVAATATHDVHDADKFRRQEIARRNSLGLSKGTYTEFINALSAAADQFIVNRASGKTIIAGYHWFADWGRDTMIALPGLTLATGRYEIAKSILSEFARHVNQGMLPNRFPDAGEKPKYNTVDATLWFFEAVRSLLDYTKDYEFVRENLYAVLTDIIEWHVKGARYHVHVDEDGLLFSGEPGVQLTWMDAKVGDWVVTPRTGKAVEIQALWYNALRVMEHLAGKFHNSKAGKSYAVMADRTFDSFNHLFWNEAAGCLYDVVNEGERDQAIRPNQIFAVSLSHSMVSQERAKSILQVVARELLTPRGLRTLSPKDANYIGRYEGDPRKRDSAYHQGTVWLWLMGAYITAHARTFGPGAGRKFAAEWLDNFAEHLREAGLGQVSEIFDGDTPHSPRGCIAQAWSVAELLRALVEGVCELESSKAVKAT